MFTLPTLSKKVNTVWSFILVLCAQALYAASKRNKFYHSLNFFFIYRS